MNAVRVGATFLVTAVALLVLGSDEAVARKKVDYQDKPIPQWREGPIRYIITKWEDNEYKSLETEEERARFIESFWKRRDQTPATPGNEFRAEFWKRVRDANHLYGEGTSRAGWWTDMGKIHILKGPPDDITRDLVAEGHRGTVVWTYRNSSTPGVGPNVVIAFARDVTGEFRLSTEPSKDSDPKQGIPVRYQPPMGTAALAEAQLQRAQEGAAQLFNLTDPLIRQAGGPASATPLALLTELAKLQQPSREWEIRESITTQEFFGAVPIRARADFFKTTGPNTLVLLTAAVKSSAVHYRTAGGREMPDTVFYGRIMDLTANELVASLEKDGDFVPAAENPAAGLDDDLVFQARVLLAPGIYKALLTVLDRVGGRAGSYQISITVPDFSPEALTLSSVTPARSIGAAQAAAPYVMGNLRILPRLSQTFHPGDDLSFYYQVYGAAADPATDEKLLDVDYGFYTVEAEQTRDLGHITFAGQKNESHGYTLSLKDWPVGPYLLRISVTDRVAGANTSRDLVFEVR
jgi:GWxTD domain-containing protein